MKKIGYILATFGFLAGSLVSVIDQSKIRWELFAPAVAAGAIGVALIHLAKRRHSKSETTVSANMQLLEFSIERIVANLARLNAEKDSINTYDFRWRIDELFPQDIAAFVEARESIAHAHGLAAYADVMTDFAAAERYLNRVWSASADGYIDEVNTYLDKAQQQFTESLSKIRQLVHA
jgi:hypothetical protein